MIGSLLPILLLTSASALSAQMPSEDDRLAREIYAELVNIDTSSKPGTTRYEPFQSPAPRCDVVTYEARVRTPWCDSA